MITHEPIIRFADVSKKFNRHIVLDHLNMEIEAGECRVIMGPSGVGKTVLLKAIIGLVRPDSGQVWVFGRDVATLDRTGLDDMRKSIGYVFQLSALFDSMTVAENVALGLEMHGHLSRRQVQARVEESLRRVDLPDTEPMRPAELSGGMKKRVAIARALAIQPKLVLYDEPTTGLDPASCKTIQELIRKLNRDLGITSAVVTHDTQTALAVADHVSLLGHGRIIAHGRPQELQEGGILERFARGEVI